MNKPITLPEALKPKKKAPKGVGDYLDIEGRPFLIKKIMTGSRLVVKGMDHWPHGEPDWRKNDNENRKLRKMTAEGIKEAIKNELNLNGNLEMSPEFAEGILIPLLLGDLPPRGDIYGDAETMD